MVQRAVTSFFVQLASVMPANVLQGTRAASVRCEGLVLLTISNSLLLMVRCPVAGQAVGRVLIGLEEVCRTFQGVICPPKVICSMGYDELRHERPVPAKLQTFGGTLGITQQPVIIPAVAWIDQSLGGMPTAANCATICMPLSFVTHAMQTL